MKINDLQSRVEWVWRQTLEIHRQAPETRIASSLSPIEIFVALYYGELLQFKASDPRTEQRDRLIISKGHGSICMYPILADLGFFPKEELDRVCKKGGILGGIPDPIIPGYETINGSLGHGLGVAAGIAIGQRQKADTMYWSLRETENRMRAPAGKPSCWLDITVSKTCLIVDNNSIAMLGYTGEIVSHGDLHARLSSFGWDVADVDGHDIGAVHRVLGEVKSSRDGKPKAVIARTLKGRGVDGLENHPLSHIINPKRQTLDDLLGADS